MIDRYGEADLSSHYRAFDTICRATQDRQDAVMALLEERRLDVMLVVGGYNSSNTRNLARICADRVPTYHIADAACLVSPADVRHRPVRAVYEAATTRSKGQDEVIAGGWLPQSGPLSIGLTAGASTPNTIIGRVVNKLEQFTADADV